MEFLIYHGHFWCEFTLRSSDAHLRCRVHRLNKNNIIFGADTHIIGCIASMQFHVLIFFEIKNIKTLKWKWKWNLEFANRILYDSPFDRTQFARRFSVVVVAVVVFSSADVISWYRKYQTTIRCRERRESRDENSKMYRPQNYNTFYYYWNGI